MSDKKKCYAATDFETYVGPSKLKFKKGEEVKLNPEAISKINPDWLAENPVEENNVTSINKTKKSNKKD